MPLPGAHTAYVPPRKLTDYLLSNTHPRGMEKARYLRSYGFTIERVTALEAALLSIAQTGVLVEVEQTDHGTTYVVIGSAPTPDGGMIRLTTVWIVETDETRPRFVTAYPVRGHHE